MFGGHRICADGLFVAIVVDDVLYLKCDALGLPPFVYTAKDGRAMTTKHGRAPDEAPESGAEMQRCRRLAAAAALAKSKHMAAPAKPAARRGRRRMKAD